MEKATIHGLVIKIPVQIGDHRFVSEVAFSEDLRIGFNLMGRRGMFEAFEAVIFREKAWEVEFVVS